MENKYPGPFCKELNISIKSLFAQTFEPLTHHSQLLNGVVLEIKDITDKAGHDFAYFFNLLGHVDERFRQVKKASLLMKIRRLVEYKKQIQRKKRIPGFKNMHQLLHKVFEPPIPKKKTTTEISECIKEKQTDGDQSSTTMIMEESVDPGYERPAHRNGQVLPETSFDSSILREQLKQMVQNKGDKLKIKNAIEHLLQKNESILSKSRYRRLKPQTNTVNTMTTEIGNELKSVIQPKDPTASCSKEDMSYIKEALVEVDVTEPDSDTDKDLVCAVSSKVVLKLSQGQSLFMDITCYWCNFCGFKTDKKEKLLQHGMEHRFLCKYCKYQSFSRSAVIKHSFEKHPDFAETASNFKYCSFLPDIVQRHDTRKRKTSDIPCDETISSKKPRNDPQEIVSSLEVEEVQEKKEIESATEEKIMQLQQNVITNTPLPATIKPSKLPPKPKEDTVVPIITKTSLPATVEPPQPSKLLPKPKEDTVEVPVIRKTSLPATVQTEQSPPPKPKEDTVVPFITKTSVPATVQSAQPPLLKPKEDTVEVPVIRKTSVPATVQPTQSPLLKPKEETLEPVKTSVPATVQPAQPQLLKPKEETLEPVKTSVPATVQPAQPQLLKPKEETLEPVKTSVPATVQPTQSPLLKRKEETVEVPVIRKTSVPATVQPAQPPLLKPKEETLEPVKTSLPATVQPAQPPLLKPKEETLEPVKTSLPATVQPAQSPLLKPKEETLEPVKTSLPATVQPVQRPKLLPKLPILRRILVPATFQPAQPPVPKLGEDNVVVPLPLPPKLVPMPKENNVVLPIITNTSLPLPPKLVRMPKDDNMVLPVKTNVISGEQAVTAVSGTTISKRSSSNYIPPAAAASLNGAQESNQLIDSDFCWKCGYCDFVTLSESFLGIHLNTKHQGKVHNYVATLVSSAEQLVKIKASDQKIAQDKTRTPLPIFLLAL